MNIQIITPQQWQSQAWKNGRGVTHELASEQDMEGILWRVSIAEVTQDGPFSLFPGKNRILLLLEGAGFSLTFQESQKVKIMERLYEPFSFAGEEEIACTLLDGPVRDFNVMSRRADVRATVQVLRLKAQESCSIAAVSKQLLYVATGSVAVVIDQERYVVQHEETLLMNEGFPSCSLVSQDSEVLVFSITFSKHVS